jgi:hypothetical protein
MKIDSLTDQSDDNKVMLPKRGLNPKDAIGRAKVSFSLVPPVARAVEAVVMALGAMKYGPFNWRSEPVNATVYLDAIQRHLDAYSDGQDLDEESGASHLGHIRACCAILLDAEATGNLNDDRHKSAGGVVTATLGKLNALMRDLKPAKQLPPQGG